MRSYHSSHSNLGPGRLAKRAQASRDVGEGGAQLWLVRPTLLHEVNIGRVAIQVLGRHLGALALHKESGEFTDGVRGGVRVR